MRGTDCEQSGMFSYISAERRVRKDHPLRAIRAMVHTALKESSRSRTQVRLDQTSMRLITRFRNLLGMPSYHYCPVFGCEVVRAIATFRPAAIARNLGAIGERI
jgi:hypothetical protein